jgi:two-component system NtrC family sensor kinase
MQTPLNILFVEDDETDYLLIKHYLEVNEVNFDSERVDTETSLHHALSAKAWDLVLIDFKLPKLDFKSVMKQLETQRPIPPSIIISGTITENDAIELLKGGVKDYINKNNLSRLIPALERCVQEAKVQAAKRQMQIELKAREEQVTMLLNSTAEGIIGLDLDGCITFINPSALNILGYDNAKELKGLNVNRLIKSEHLCDSTSEDKCTTYEWHSDDLRVHQEKKIFCHRSGSFVPVEFSVHSTIKNEVKIGAVMTFIDIIERLESEKVVTKYVSELEHLNEELRQKHMQLVQSEKLASIGMLAAGLAHEINNPLSYVMMNLKTIDDYASESLEMLRLVHKELINIKLPLEWREHFRTVFNDNEYSYIENDMEKVIADTIFGAERINKIVLSMKKFSHKSTDNWDAVNVNECIESALQVTWAEIKTKAKVDKCYGQLPMVTCKELEIDQAIVILLLNAVHSISDKGTITITTKLLGDSVGITVADTGLGIDPKYIGKIFAPFFTTKPEGVGTGLGLSILYGIVERHKGTVIVDSVPGKGSSFILTLPIMQHQ